MDRERPGPRRPGPLVRDMPPQAATHEGDAGDPLPEATDPMMRAWLSERTSSRGRCPMPDRPPRARTNSGATTAHLGVMVSWARIRGPARRDAAADRALCQPA